MKTIFHIDVNNAFLSWTAVYLLNNGYNKDIREIPSIISGNQEERHGIVLAKSPLAKKYKIKTGESIYEAKQKYNQIEIYEPNFEWYKKESKELMEYLKQYSLLLEQFSIDECFLDMTRENYDKNNYVDLAYKIKNEIKNKFNFTVNIGIANNKLCAKMASDFEKPDKVHTLWETQIATKLWPLDVEDLFMCGRKTSEKLKQMKINTIFDLAHTKKSTLIKQFGTRANYLYDAAWGKDESSIQTHKRKEKSIGVQSTLKEDTNDITYINNIIYNQIKQIAEEIKKKKLYSTTIVIFIKDSNFKTTSFQTKLRYPTNDVEILYNNAKETIQRNYNNNYIRLIGIRLKDLTHNTYEQMSIYDYFN